MKKITFLCTYCVFFKFSQTQKTDFADFKGAFGGTIHTPNRFNFQLELSLGQDLLT